MDAQRSPFTRFLLLSNVDGEFRSTERVRPTFVAFV